MYSVIIRAIVILRNSRSNEFSIFHMYRTVRDLRQILIMSDNDKGLSELITEIKEELMKLCLILRVKTSRRLIGEDDSGIIDEGTGNGDTLFLTT